MLYDTIIKGQSLYDFALQHGGSADTALLIAELNGLSLDFVALAPQQLAYSLEDADTEQLSAIHVITREGVVPCNGTALFAPAFQGIGADGVGVLYVGGFDSGYALHGIGFDSVGSLFVGLDDNLQEVLATILY